MRWLIQRPEAARRRRRKTCRKKSHVQVRRRIVIASKCRIPYSSYTSHFIRDDWVLPNRETRVRVIAEASNRAP